MFHGQTVVEIRGYCKDNGIDAPSKLRKEQLIAYIEASLKERELGVTSTAKCVTEVKVHPVYVDSSLDWSEHLDMKGWTVIPIPGWDEHNFVSDFFDFIEQTSADSGGNFSRHDRSTWLCKNMPILLHGIFKHYIGHTEFCWKIRELCAPIFATLYGMEEGDLVSSFDGANFSVPKRTNGLKQWFHVDYARTDEERDHKFCQGVVNFLDSGKNDGGLVLLEDSHLDYHGYLERHPSYGYSWSPIDMSDTELSKRRVIKVCAPAGHLLMWDSRMVHCNSSPTSDNFRMCTYVAMQPRCMLTEKELKKGVELYEKGRMTGHARYGDWFSANPENPRSYGGPLVRPRVVEIATRNELRSRLIGY